MSCPIATKMQLRLCHSSGFLTLTMNGLNNWSINYLCKYKPSQKSIPFFLRELRGSMSLIIGPKPLFQSDAFDMKLKFYFHANKTHFHRTSLYQTSFWKWGFLEIGNGLLHIYFRSLLHKDAKKFDERQENWHLLKEEKSQWQIQGRGGWPRPPLIYSSKLIVKCEPPTYVKILFCYWRYARY